jgi:hypothetical protein
VHTLIENELLKKSLEVIGDDGRSGEKHWGCHQRWPRVSRTATSISRCGKRQGRELNHVVWVSPGARRSYAVHLNHIVQFESNRVALAYCSEHPEFYSGINCCIEVPQDTVHLLREALSEEVGPREQHLAWVTEEFSTTTQFTRRWVG